jgi:N-acetylornithine carbamoyltransferase
MNNYTKKRKTQDLKGRSFLSTQDWPKEDLIRLLDLAQAMKSGKGPARKSLRGKSVALLFFNPSLRTRTSMELAAYQLGGKAVVLQPGKDAWPIEVRDGVVMDGDAEEHVKEAVKVLAGFCDAIAVRSFPKFQNWSEDKKDPVLSAVDKWSSKPVINMETIVHPLQELALAMTMQQHFGADLTKKKFLLTWTYHPKPLNTAVANSAALIATRLGMDLTILRPPGYDLDEDFMAIARLNAQNSGRSVTVTDNINEAYTGADFVYAKSWGSLKYFGRWDEEKPIREGLKHFIVDPPKMELTNRAFFSHCLPLRRNVKAADEVVDAEYSLVYEEANNRLHTAKALLAEVL